VLTAKDFYGETKKPIVVRMTISAAVPLGVMAIVVIILDLLGMLID
jgi:hypothetical protein